MTEEEEAEREELCSASKTRLRIMEKHLQRLEEQVSSTNCHSPHFIFMGYLAKGPWACHSVAHARDVA